MKSENAAASPAKALLEDITTFQNLFRSTLASLSSRMDKDLAVVIAKAETLVNPEAIPDNKLHDIRDMITLLRSAEVKPGKGRRKDIKKLESIKDDLLMLVEKW